MKRQALEAAVAPFYQDKSLPLKARGRLAGLSEVSLVSGDENTPRTAAGIAVILTYCDIQPDGTFIRGSGRIPGPDNATYAVGPESGVLSQLLSPGLHRCSYVSGPLQGPGAENAVYKLDFDACRACLRKHNGDGRFNATLDRLGAICTETDEGEPKGDALRRGYGGPPESDEHRRLKFFVQAHPERFGAPVGCAAEAERLLKSGDEIDVLCGCPDEQLAIEVKSVRSTDLDIERGIFQCEVPCRS